MQILRPRIAEKPTPGIGAESHDTRQSPFEIAKSNRAQECGKIAAQSTHGGFVFFSGIDGRDEEYGCPRELGNDRLWNGRWHPYSLLTQ